MTCSECGKTFRTTETIDNFYDLRIQSGEVLEIFNKTKYLESMISCYTYKKSTVKPVRTHVDKVLGMILNNEKRYSTKDLEKMAVDMFVKNELYEEALKYIATYCPERLKTDFSEVLENL
jgi:transcriptional regulator NrdR family protein